MVKDNVIKMSSAVLSEIKNMSLNVNNGFMDEAYDNYKNTVELFLHLESELPANHSIIKNVKKALSGFTPIMESFLREDAEVLSMMTEATKAEKDAKKAEEMAKKEELKRIKDLKSDLKEDYKTIKEICDGLNGSISNTNFKLTRWHLNEMILLCNEMKTKIAGLIGEEPGQNTDVQDTIA